MTENTRGALTRRSLLTAGGATAAAGVVALPFAGLFTPQSQAADSDAPASPTGGGPHLALENIQGNIIGGFNKDHQRLLFFRLGRRAPARRWLSTLVDEIATSKEVLAFNALFKAARARRGSEGSTPTSSWVNVAFTHPGLAALGVPQRDLSPFPEAFRQGMAARASVIGDRDESAPSTWVGPRDDGSLDGVLLLAADTESALAALTSEHRSRLSSSGITVVFDQHGQTRSDQPGHEHFGFRDGISQPGIRGITEPQDPENADQGQPGQDLLWPGEFVLGYPTQIAHDDPDDPGELNVNPGPKSHAGPPWTTDGSFLVFRRLRQDVSGFQQFVADVAAAQGISADQAGAKIVGRYPSGAPLAPVEDHDPRVDTTAADPSVADPSLLKDERINNFEFGEDTDGAVVPLAAHIRKTYPRDTRTPTGGESDTQTHRLLRRGIPYGVSYDATTPDDPQTGAQPVYPHDRGLLFLCYQSSIEHQFEFVQNRWVNNPNAPRRGAGHDLVIAQADQTRTFSLPGGKPDHLTLMQRFVTTTGGAYLFQPSITALRKIADGDVNPAPPRRPEPEHKPAPPRKHRPPKGRKPRRGRPGRKRG